jgi:hypothetical protein
MEKFTPKKLVTPICLDCKLFDGVCREGAIPTTPSCREKKLGDSGVVYTLVGGEVRMVERNKPQK